LILKKKNEYQVTADPHEKPSVVIIPNIDKEASWPIAIEAIEE
jgi:hypothetical protein